MTLSPSEEPLPNTITLGIQFQHVNIAGGGGTNSGCIHFLLLYNKAPQI